MEVAESFEGWDHLRQRRAVRLLLLIFGGFLRISEAVSLEWDSCTKDGNLLKVLIKVSTWRLRLT